MPVYNGAAYLPAAVDSILAQSVGDFELIAIDDGSSDNSLDVLRRLAQRDARVHVISRPNTGIVQALNDGVSAARGEFIARMDSDDIALPHRFERQLEFLRCNSDCVAVGSAVLQIDSEGDPICVQPWALEHDEIDRMLMRGGGGLAHPTAMIRTSALLQVAAYRTEYEWVEDKDLWLRLAEVGRLANLAEPLLLYRLHETSVCWQREAQQQHLMEKLLAETFERRGMSSQPPTSGRVSRTASDPNRVRAKWVRAAARSGNYRTAAKHAKRLLQERPLQASTWLTLARALASAPRFRRAA
jgi:glycosyltransferase involved in cell wall biosynthesis